MDFQTGKATAPVGGIGGFLRKPVSGIHEMATF
jgi:hypothetical protein